MALAKDRLIKRREKTMYSDPIAANTRIYKGALACLDATGNAVPGSTSTTLKARGVCFGGTDSTGQANNLGGAAGAVRADIRPGVYPFKNSASGDLITRADIKTDCYIVDDETVAKTSGTSTRSIAGKVIDVDSDGVWVEVGM
jgi:hypothetical protein